MGKFAELSFLRAAEVPCRPGDPAFRNKSRFFRIAADTITKVVAAALLLAPPVAPGLLRDYDLETWPSYYLGGLSAIFSLLTVVTAWASLKPSTGYCGLPPTAYM